MDYLLEGSVFVFIGMTFYGVIILFFSFREQLTQTFKLRRDARTRSWTSITFLFFIFL